MSVDLQPIITAVVEIAGLALAAVGTSFISWAAATANKRWNTQISAANVAAFDDQLTKAVTFGAMQSQKLIAEKGWDHIDVKNQVLSLALTSLVSKAGDTLKTMGLTGHLGLLDPKYTHDKEIIQQALLRVFPSAMAAVASSPSTPPTPEQRAVLAVAAPAATTIATQT